MRLSNDFTVAAPLDRTWSVLLDLERVASCLPGARLLPGPDDSVHRGEMKVRLGPLSLAYEGTARILEIDHDTRTTAIEVRGKEAKGAGTASAVIQNRLERHGQASTRVIVETDLKVTGRPAQFGRGMMEDVAGRMLDDFAARLQAEVLDGSAAADASARRNGAHGEAPAGGPPVAPAAAGGDSGQGAGPAPDRDPARGVRAASAPDDVLDLGSFMSRSLLTKLAPVAALGALALAVAVTARRTRRPRVSLELRYRW